MEVEGRQGEAARSLGEDVQAGNSGKIERRPTPTSESSTMTRTAGPLFEVLNPVAVSSRRLEAPDSVIGNAPVGPVPLTKGTTSEMGQEGDHRSSANS